MDKNNLMTHPTAQPYATPTIDHPDHEPDLYGLQPNSRQCFGCGVENAAGLQIRFYSDGPGAAIARVMLGPKHQGFPGIAHGGIVATMLDEIMGRAALSTDPQRLLYTAKMEVRYRQTVPLYQMLTLKGRIDKDRGRLVVASGEIYLPDGTVAAEVTGTLVEVPKDQLADMNTPEVGWQVYPLDEA
jgi:acyl-coenzyme A thioesterase PaaI-like protein